MYTIGEFSQLAGISARMLRHYGKLGLLKPAYVGENGYRYYDGAQLCVLRQIETLKQYGFTLAEIYELLPLSGQALQRRIHVRRLRAHEELYALRRSLRQMEEEIIKLEGSAMQNEKYHVILMDVPAQKVFSIRRTISISQMDALFQELHREMEARALRRAGPTQHRYIGDTFDYDAMDVEAQAEVAEDGDGVITLPACTCAATTHIGPYESIKYAYDAIADWFKAHPEYEPAGPAIERYIKDEAMAKSEEELETGVLFPVRKKS